MTDKPQDRRTYIFKTNVEGSTEWEFPRCGTYDEADVNYLKLTIRRDGGEMRPILVPRGEISFVRLLPPVVVPAPQADFIVPHPEDVPRNRRGRSPSAAQGE